MARKRTASRPDRWREAVAEAQQALDAVEAAKEDLTSALGNLRDVQAEYQDWRDNLPENLANGTLGDKLNTVADMDLEPDEDDLGAMRAAVEEAEGADLPLGFGRD